MEPPEAIAALFATAGFASTARLAAAYLQVCRDREEQLAALQRARVKLKPPFGGAEGPIAVGAADVVEDIVHTQVEHAPTWMRAVRLANACGEATHTEDDRFVLACRIAAELLDHVCGRHFAAELTRGELVAAGDPIPNVAVDLRPIFESGAQLTSTRSRLDEFPIDHVPNLALATRAGARFEADDDDRFPGPRPDLAAAWFDPTIGVVWHDDDNQNAHHLRISVTTAGKAAGGPHYFIVEPCDHAANAARALALLGEADAAGCEIAIAPELTLGGDAVLAITQWLRTANTMRAVVCGSRHHRRPDGRYVNRLTVLLRRPGHPEVFAARHDKFNCFDFTDAKRKARYFEDIATTGARLVTRVRIEKGVPRWSYATAICKDLLSEDFGDLMRDAAPTLVLAPTMTPKFGAFGAMLAGFAGHGQTTTILANHADRHTPAVVVTRPLEQQGRIDRARPSRGLLVFYPFRING